ncbi:hypothetical protein [Rhodococcus sp. NPDC003348]
MHDTDREGQHCGHSETERAAASRHAPGEWRSTDAAFNALTCVKSQPDSALASRFSPYSWALSGGVRAGIGLVGFPARREIVSMVGRIVRAGGAVLAALAIVAGGALAGVGSAGAQSSEEGFQGSVGDLLFDFTVIGFPPCPPISQDNMPCDDGRFSSRAVVGDIGVGFKGTRELDRGDTAQMETTFWVEPPIFDQQPNLQIASTTVRTPRGFVFTGGEVKAGLAQMLDATFAVDPATGDVTATAPAGGWAIPSYQNSDGRFRTGSVTVVLNYEATEYVSQGEAAVRFSGTGTPESDWVLTGKTQVVPELVSTINSGSTVGSSRLFGSSGS